MSDFGMQQVNHAWSGYFAWVSGWRRCRRPCKTLESQMGKLLVARAAATAFGRDEFSLLDAPGNIALRFLRHPVRRREGSRLTSTATA